MEEAENTFLKIAIKRNVKREIDIIAAMEQRSVYEVVADMVNDYKAKGSKTSHFEKGGITSTSVLEKAQKPAVRLSGASKAARNG